MPAPWNDILSKLEAAEASLVTALGLTGQRGTETVDVTVLTGLDDDATLTPRVTCHAEESSEEVVRGTGIFRVRSFIHIHSHSGDETLATHRARVGSVIDAIMQDDIASQLALAASDFHCYDVKFIGPQADPEGNSFHTALEIEAVVCGSDIT
jgi:hypothetical protein